MNNEGAYIRTLQNLHRDSIPDRWSEITMGKAPHKWEKLRFETWASLCNQIAS